MSKLEIPLICLAALATASLTGCVDLYGHNYVAAIPAVGAPSPAQSPAAAKPKVVESPHLRADVARFKTQGYAVLGHSAFQATSYMWLFSPIRQAKAVGADLVLLKTKDLGPTDTSSMQSVMTGTDSDGTPVYEDQWVASSYETYKNVAVFMCHQTPPVATE